MLGVTWPWPWTLFKKFLMDHVGTVPGNVQAKSEVRCFNRVGAVCILQAKILEVTWHWPRALSENFLKRSCDSCRRQYIKADCINDDSNDRLINLHTENSCSKITGASTLSRQMMTAIIHWTIYTLKIAVVKLPVYQHCQGKWWHQ